MYVNTFSRPLYGPEGNESTRQIQVTTSEISQSFTAELLQGGQRLLLPDQARDVIIDALLNNESLEIVAGPYQGTILPTKFRKFFASNI